MFVCFVEHCAHTNTTESCRFFSFPRDITLRQRWLSLIGKNEEEPESTSRVCSCHFLSGNKSVGPVLFDKITKKSRCKLDEKIGELLEKNKEEVNQTIKCEAAETLSLNEPKCDKNDDIENAVDEKSEDESHPQNSIKKKRQCDNDSPLIGIGMNTRSKKMRLCKSKASKYQEKEVGLHPEVEEGKLPFKIVSIQKKIVKLASLKSEVLIDNPALIKPGSTDSSEVDNIMVNENSEKKKGLPTKEVDDLKTTEQNPIEHSEIRNEENDQSIKELESTLHLPEVEQTIVNLQTSSIIEKNETTKPTEIMVTPTSNIVIIPNKTQSVSLNQKEIVPEIRIKEEENEGMPIMVLTGQIIGPIDLERSKMVVKSKTKIVCAKPKEWLLIPSNDESRKGKKQTESQLQVNKVVVPNSLTENEILQKRVKELEMELKESQEKLSMKSIESDPKKVFLYTGMPNSEVFYAFLDHFDEFEISSGDGETFVKLKRENQLLMTLMKLRMNLPDLDLSFRFACSLDDVINTITTWICVLHEALTFEITSQKKEDFYFPTCYDLYRRNRMILDSIIVCTGIPKVEQDPDDLHNFRVMKGLIGMAPNSVVTFCSRLYSENEAYKGALNNIGPDDLILAETGFMMTDFLPDGVSVSLPPFLEVPDITQEQQSMSHVPKERTQLKRSVNRVQEYVVLEEIPASLSSVADKIWQICCSLTNLQNSLMNGGHKVES